MLFLQFEVSVDNTWLMEMTVSKDLTLSIQNWNYRVKLILKRDCSFLHCTSFLDGCSIYWWHSIIRTNPSLSPLSQFRKLLHSQHIRCVIKSSVSRRLQRRYYQRLLRILWKKHLRQYQYLLDLFSYLDCGAALDSRANCLFSGNWLNLFHI